MRSPDSSSCRSCSVRAGYWLSPRWRLSGCTLRCRSFRRRDCGPARPRLPQDVADAHRIYATGGFLDVLAFRLREIPLIAALHVYIFPRTIGLFLLGAFAWRTGILRNPSRHLLFSIAAACIGLGAALILCHAGGLIASGRHPRPGRTSRHHPAGAGLWRWHHRHRQSRERKAAAGLGRAARTHGLHQLPRAIRHPWLDLLRLWSRPVRPPRRGQRAGHRRCRLHRDRCLSAPGGCAVTATARSNGCGAR